MCVLAFVLRASGESSFVASWVTRSRSPFLPCSLPTNRHHGLAAFLLPLLLVTKPEPSSSASRSRSFRLATPHPSTARLGNDLMATSATGTVKEEQQQSAALMFDSPTSIQLPLPPMVSHNSSSSSGGAYEGSASGAGGGGGSGGQLGQGSYGEAGVAAGMGLRMSGIPSGNG